MRPDDDRDPVDLDERVCVRCGRGLEPWDDECQACREPAVLRFALPPAPLGPPPAHLRDAVEPDAAEAGQTAEVGQAGEAASAGHAPTADAALEIREEVVVPVDETGGLPPVPPVGGDPHLG